ncbi:hypothetical protein RFI_38150 [Reticulomyxa filosa]|uniref:Uncharacterized protein n=1 Tax=Reticulomyxa filosa TaxID=46433 RepID=X6LD89_RETFI|nr:hypothetical protein RFI_38150 [Reticulomyxa filosa]|eukprot:ETN99330.1 hypothetical protein RFI_38150 [Reticulomyxa filosa]
MRNHSNLRESRFGIIKEWSEQISNHEYYRCLKDGLTIYEIISVIVVMITDLITFGVYVNNHKHLDGWVHYQCYAQILFSSSNGKTLLVNVLRIIVGNNFFLILIYFQKKKKNGVE